MGGQVRIERDGALGWLVFDHPERRNAISREMWEAIPKRAAELDADPDVRVVVLRGAGEVAFVSGADISEFERSRVGDAVSGYERDNAQAFLSLSRLHKPVIAMIHGFCVGGGMAIALTAALRYAADDARLGIPAARLGLGYHPGGIETLVDLVGPSTAKEVFFSARRFRAEEALARGLVNEVVPKAELEARVRTVATEMAENAPLTLRSVKLVVRELAKDPARRGHERMQASVAACFESEDYKEGVAAFLEKRTPRFRGR